jgi:hypothetical protein
VQAQRGEFAKADDESFGKDIHDGDFKWEVDQIQKETNDTTNQLTLHDPLTHDHTNLQVT